VEAKGWDLPPTDLDGCANQTVKYALDDGTDFAVLTNGLIWRLYDRRLPGKPPDMLAAEVRLDEEADAVRFLSAIGKESVKKGGLEKFAESESQRRKALIERRKILDFLREQLHDPESQLVGAVHSVLTQQVCFRAVAPEEVASCLQELAEPDSVAASPTANPRGLGLSSSKTPPSHPEGADAIDTVVGWVNEVGKMEWKRKRNKFYTGLQCDKRKKGCSFVHFGGREDRFTLSAEVSQKSEWVMKLKGQGLDADVKEDRFVRVKGLTADSLRKHRDVLRELVGKAVTEYEARKPELRDHREE
jgi:hypothetical protein